MLIYVLKKKLFTDGRTDGQPKTIVRNLTIKLRKIYFRILKIIVKFIFEF